MIWEVFRQADAGDYHTHCGNVHAPDRELAEQFATIQHGRRKPTNSLWVVPKAEVSEVDADDVTFGGTTDKAYRWATAYATTGEDAVEVAESEDEQATAERQRGDD